MDVKKYERSQSGVHLCFYAFIPVYISCIFCVHTKQIQWKEAGADEYEGCIRENVKSYTVCFFVGKTKLTQFICGVKRGDGAYM